MTLWLQMADWSSILISVCACGLLVSQVVCIPEIVLVIRDANRPPQQFFAKQILELESANVVEISSEKDIMVHEVIW